MTSEPDLGSAAGPLSPAQLEEIAEAGQKLARILRAGKVAGVSGWTLIAFGGLSALFGLTSLTGLLTAGALLALGWNELRGRTLLEKLDPLGARILRWNQFGIIGFIVAYCLWRLYSSLANPDPQMVELEELVGISQELVAQVTMVVYGTVVVITALVQGLLSRFYFAREAMLKSYLEETPPWIVSLQKSTSSP
jgi:hypothetical protein